MQHTRYRESLFRVEATSSFCGMFACLLLVGSAFVVVAHFGWDRPFYWFWDGIVAPMLYALLLLGAIAYLRLRLTVSVMPEGLRTFDIWGRDHLAPWAEIERVSRWSFFGMPSARLVCRGIASPLWLPLNLERRDRFDEMVRDYTEAGHPLRELLAPRRKPQTVRP